MKYEINNLEEFVESARKIVFGGFGKSVEETKDEFTQMMESLSDEEQAELDSVLSQKESEIIVQSLVKKEKNKKTKEIRYLINENIFAEILDALNARLVSNILSNLNKRGLIESAYDETLNDFVFWVKENEEG